MIQILIVLVLSDVVSITAWTMEKSHGIGGMTAAQVRIIFFNISNNYRINITFENLGKGNIVKFFEQLTRIVDKFLGSGIMDYLVLKYE